MGYNKFITKDDNVLLDLTQDDITADDVLNGKTFHDKTGDKKTGIAVATEEWDGTFTVTGEPTTDSGSGGEGGNTFTFKIDGVEYTAEAGMSWEEWVNSGYNTANVTIANYNHVIFASCYLLYPSDIVSGNISTYAWEGIVKDYKYIPLRNGGSLD